ncbi:threonine--tRNA ligase [Candidatus Woesearchaeota archaeon]|nr:threonine--tRNA ligase [Candidatus Woesearchaeota archaeon]
MKIVFPDSSKKEFSKGTTGLEIAKSIGERLAMAAVAIEVSGVLQDLNQKIEKDAKVRIITLKDKEGVEVFRHSSAHILGAAVTELFPKAKTAIGPAVEQGFYYDFASSPFTPEDLEKINKKMEEIVKQNIPFERIELTKAEAKKLFKDNKYKLELIEEAEGNISAYKLGKFTDLCRGPHVPSTGIIKAIKTTKMSSAYWKGDAKNDSLQRIYGISFTDKKELDNYFKIIEEAEKRNHVKIGKEMDLFSFHEEGPGFPFFHEKGTFIWNTLIDFMRSEMKKLGYQENKTPIILNEELWKKSGHWDHYKQNMYFTKIDGKEFAVKPMNCPGNLLIYKSTPHSYKELPIKAGEFGLVHRHEMSGVLNGLFRVRNFTQDDAHIFCTEEQLKEQIVELMNLIDKVYKTFGFEYLVELSTKPEKAMGSKEIWNKAEAILKDALKGRNYRLNEGEGAFYGPKIDFHIKDALGRTWQCGTIQLDFSMPEKFDLEYDGKDGKKHRPVMLHRAIYGSVERFLGNLIEHYAGKFPLWINPNQVKILPIADRHIDYANQVAKAMTDQGIRVEVDTRVESTPKKIYNAQIEKFNYILVVGDKEVQNKTANVRTRDEVVHGEKKVDLIIKELLEEIKTKAIK